jgi:hypothetical protein
VLPDTENADVGGVHDADGEPGNSGGVVVEVPRYVGTLPGRRRALRGGACQRAGGSRERAGGSYLHIQIFLCMIATWMI